MGLDGNDRTPKRANEELVPHKLKKDELVRMVHRLNQMASLAQSRAATTEEHARKAYKVADETVTRVMQTNIQLHTIIKGLRGELSTIQWWTMFFAGGTLAGVAYAAVRFFGV